MTVIQDLDIDLTQPICSQNITEDEQRQLAQNLKVVPRTGEFAPPVRSSDGVQTVFNFPDGRFTGTTAKIDGQAISVIPGNALFLVQGPATSSSVPAGWEINVEASVLLRGNTSDNQASWPFFFISRVDVLTP